MRFDRLRRREFITLVGGAVACPIAAHAQPTNRVRRIGMLMMYAETDPRGQAFAAAFRAGLRQLGWTEDGNVHLEYRWATSDPQLIERSARELVALEPDLILSTSAPTTAALLHQTRTIPIIFGNLADPVGSGFVESLSRPAGNVTGFINVEPAMTGKWVELLKAVAPHVTRVAAVFNPAAAPYIGSYLDAFKAVAPSFGVEAVAAPVNDKPELEAVIAAQAREPNGGLMVMPDGFMFAFQADLTAAAARHRLPATYFFRSFAQHGGLLSYANDIVDNYRRAAAYADRILKGEKPGGLPVQSPIKFELVINLKTAKALGLDVPASLLARADEVIE
jgi:putative tryptophan/tyrosine transport system substrate-binding protein